MVSYRKETETILGGINEYFALERRQESTSILRNGKTAFSALSNVPVERLELERKVNFYKEPELGQWPLKFSMSNHEILSF